MNLMILTIKQMACKQFLIVNDKSESDRSELHAWVCRKKYAPSSDETRSDLFG